MKQLKDANEKLKSQEELIKNLKSGWFPTTKIVNGQDMIVK